MTETAGAQESGAAGMEASPQDAIGAASGETHLQEAIGAEGPATSSTPASAGQSGAEGLKRCSKCGKAYPPTADYFHRSNGKLKPYCKPCALQYWQSYYTKKTKGESSAQGNPAQGNPAQGDPAQGHPAPGDPAPGDPAQSADVPPAADRAGPRCGTPPDGHRLTPAECRRRREALRLTYEDLGIRASVGSGALKLYEESGATLSVSALRRVALILNALESSPTEISPKETSSKPPADNAPSGLRANGTHSALLTRAS